MSSVTKGPSCDHERDGKDESWLNRGGLSEGRKRDGEWKNAWDKGGLKSSTPLWKGINPALITDTIVRFFFVLFHAHR